MRITITSIIIIISTCKPLIAEPWHRYQLDKLVNEQCQPKTFARIRFMYNDLNFWSAVSIAAEAQLDSIALDGGVSGFCSGSSGSELFQCQAYIKSHISIARNCMGLAKQQKRLLMK